MSAADLFKDTYDVEFRLKGTYIMIGRSPYLVKQCFPEGPDPKDTLLVLTDLKNEDITVKLGRLPLKAMTDCPYGYYDGVWYARGPNRNRYQGILGSTMWAVYPNGIVETCGVGNVKKVLADLSTQPRTRRPGKKAHSGVITKDVYINGDKLLLRGRLRGHHLGGGVIRPLTDMSPLMRQLLDNAKLTIEDKPEIPKEFMENPCSEIIL